MLFVEDKHRELPANLHNPSIPLSARLESGAEMVIKYGPAKGKDLEMLQGLTCRALAILLSNIGK